ncbi:hypothetical protein Acr_20g0006550 [Actinidia rufa]|uniref:Uncharacterized protein n=1 Tax=Actinidia rufa TaxID=165716 RepID=A0A7J0GDG4_9ERIC|nr:hypothetical protein Acr_20g0006550 [Actinidia rufa]
MRSWVVDQVEGDVPEEDISEQNFNEEPYVETSERDYSGGTNERVPESHKKRSKEETREDVSRRRSQRRDKKNCLKNKAQDQSSEAATTAMMVVDESDVLLATSADEESDWIFDSGNAYHLCRDGKDPKWYRSARRCFGIRAEVWLDMRRCSQCRMSMEKLRGRETESMYSDREERWIHDDLQSDVLCSAPRLGGAGHLSEKVQALRFRSAFTSVEVELPIEEGQRISDAVLHILRGAGPEVGLGECTDSRERSADGENCGAVRRENRQMLRRYGDDLTIIQRVSKHFFSEVILDDSSPDQPKLRWRYRNYYGDNVGYSQSHESDAYGDKTDSENTRMQNTEEPKNPVVDPLINPLDYILGIPGSSNRFIMNNTAAAPPKGTATATRDLTAGTECATMMFLQIFSLRIQAMWDFTHTLPQAKRGDVRQERGPRGVGLHSWRERELNGPRGEGLSEPSSDTMLEEPMCLTQP